MGVAGSSPHGSPLGISKTRHFSLGVGDSLQRRHRLIKLLEKSFLSKKSLANSLTGKNSDYTARVFRDLISCWPLEDLESLHAEFESAHVVRNLFLRSVSTRTKAPTLSQQMLEALDGAVEPDFVINFKGGVFNVHKSVLVARCTYFADLFSPGVAVEGPSCSSPVQSSFDLELPPSLDVSVAEFEEFLRFVYSGEIATDSRAAPLLEYFHCLQEFYNADFARFATVSVVSGDCELTFSSRPSCAEKRDHTGDFITRSDSTFLSIRSSYFRSLFVKRRKEKVAVELAVTVDENLIPRTLVPVILYAVFTDSLDFGRVLCSTPLSTNSLCEVQAMVSGKDPNSPINRATELYHIAVFLDFQRLAQQCEDVIVRNLNLDNLVAVYNWASEAGGSKYVRRHCLNMLFADFARIANSHYLFEMSEELLYECVSSDFVQASEMDLLNAVIRWGEHEFLRKTEQLEATAGGASSPGASLRRSARRRMAHLPSNDEELKILVGDLLRLIRTPFIIPPFHQSLNEVYKRGLLTRHPYRHGLTTSSGVESNPDGHWFNFAQMSSGCSDSAFLVGPRFLRVYHSELVELIKVRYSTLGREWKYASPLDDLFSPSDVILVNSEPGILEKEEWARVRRRFYEILRECTGIRHLCVCNCTHHLNSAIDQIRLITALELNVDETLLGMEVRPHSTRSLGTGRRKDLGCKLKHRVVTGASSENIATNFLEKPHVSDETGRTAASVQPDLVASGGNGRR
ncbi:hypothetical protein QR680_005195 [Steinernema hermaphroditum]|uniref:BTB domain-containing protein n=1 Tax=Steinernema hermaphroditum TaxID=289476 RepID=A0AA39HTH1_9BILA|nr:hypothetical protein QR680_005195 [Steinernema hermaphroditum]